MSLTTQKHYPLSNASRVSGTTSLSTDLTRHSILELQELLNGSHLRCCFGQTQVVSQKIGRASSSLYILNQQQSITLCDIGS